MTLSTVRLHLQNITGGRNSADSSSIRVRNLSDISNSLLLAQVLMGSEGELFRQLAQGPSSDLGAAFRGLSSIERETLSQSLGGSLSQWTNLSQETNPEIFYGDLFNLGQRAQRDGAMEIAARTYSILLSAPGVPENLRELARIRGEMLQGAGELGMRLEHWSDHFLEEVTRPELLVGMGVGSMGFGLGRMAGARAFTGLGLRGRSVVLLSGATGLATETTGFTLASRAVAMGTGSQTQGFFDHYGQEWLSVAMMLGMMRTAGWGVRRFYGAEWVPTTGGQRFSLAASQQGAMYTSLVGSAYLHQQLGWADARPADQILSESLAMLVTFNAAGGLSRSLFGSRWQAMERNIEHQANQMERSSNPPAFPEISLLTGLQGLTLAEVNPGGPGARGRRSFQTNNIFNMSGESGEGGNKGGRKPGSPTPRRREHTRPFITESIGKPGDPHTVQGILDIMRRVQMPDKLFLTELVARDVEFRVQGSVFALSSLPRLVELLDNVTAGNRSGGDSIQIPEGRKVILHLEEGPFREEAQRIELTLGPNGFNLPLRGIHPIGAPQAPQSLEETPSDGFPVDLALPEESAVPRRLQDPNTTYPSFDEPGEMHVSESFLQFTRRIIQNKGLFQESLIKSNLVVRLESGFGFQVEGLLKILNGLPRLEEIPEMRRVNLDYREGDKRGSVVAIKLEGRFMNPLGVRTSGPDSSSPHDAQSGTNPPAIVPVTGRQARMTPPVDPETPLSPRPPDLSTPTPEVYSESQLPKVTDSLNHLPLQMRLLASGGRESDRVPTLILEGAEVDTATLEQVSNNNIAGFAEGTRWEILVPANTIGPRSFTAEVREGQIHWIPTLEASWEKARGQALFANPLVRSGAELYQLIEAISRDGGRDPNAETIIKHRGEMTQGYLDGLGEFMLGALNNYPVQGSRILLTSEAGETLLGFENVGEEGWVLKTRGVAQGAESESSLTRRVEELRASVERLPSGDALAVNFELAQIPTELLRHVHEILDPNQTEGRREVFLLFYNPVESKDVTRFLASLRDIREGQELVLHDAKGQKSLTFSHSETGPRVDVEVWSAPQGIQPLRVGSVLDFLQKMTFVNSPSILGGEVLRVEASEPWAFRGLPTLAQEALIKYRDIPYERMELVGPNQLEGRRLSRTPSRRWVEE